MLKSALRQRRPGDRRSVVAAMDCRARVVTVAHLSFGSMPHHVRFLVDDREYLLSQRIAEAVSENLIAFDPDIGFDGSPRRSVARRIERSLVDPDEGPIQLYDRHELSGLEHTLDHMAASENLEIAVLHRAVRRVLDLESPLLDELIGD
jgi:hypothetical protein